MEALCEYLAEQDLSHMVFLFDSFSSLTAQEMKLVKVLIQKSKAVIFSLTLDHAYTDSKPQEEDLLRVSKDLLSAVSFCARKRHKIKTDSFADQTRVSADLVKLETSGSRRLTCRILNPSLTDENSIQIRHADSRQTEIEQVARQIRQMVANDPQIHYHDFLVLARHLDTYETVLTPVMTEYEIPHFTDLQISMKDHPFVALIEALFAVKSHYYRYQDVMRL